MSIGTEHFLRVRTGSYWLTVDLHRNLPTLSSWTPVNPLHYPSAWPRPASDIRRSLEDTFSESRDIPISNTHSPASTALSPDPSSIPESEELSDINDELFGYDV